MTSFDVGYLDKFEIRTYYNILPEEERLVLRHKGGLNLKKISGAPGLQTYANLHLLSEESDSISITTSLLEEPNCLIQGGGILNVIIFCDAN